MSLRGTEPRMLVLHAVAALRVYRRYCETNGRRQPPEFEALEWLLATKGDISGRIATPEGVPVGPVSTVEAMYVTTSEAARLLGCSPRTVQRHIAAGRIPTTPFGIPRAALDPESVSARSAPAALRSDTAGPVT